MILLVTVSISFVLLSITCTITQIILRTTGMYTPDRDDYELRMNIAAVTGINLSNTAIHMYLCVCTHNKFCQEFVACVKQGTYCKKPPQSVCPLCLD